MARDRRGHPHRAVYATTCGSPPPPRSLVTGPPAGTITVLPAMAIGEWVDVGSRRRYTIAPVRRSSASSTPSYSVVRTRSLETVIAPSGSCGIFLSHSTLPVARLSASTSPVGEPAPLVALRRFKL